MTVTLAAGPERRVVFKRVDVYDYFAITRSLDCGAIEAMLERPAVGHTVGLYMHGGLPLAAAVIYIAYQMRDQPNQLGSGYSLLPTSEKKRVLLGRDELFCKEYGIFCGEIVKQLARFVTYRKQDIVAGFTSGKPPEWARVEFPDPLPAARDLHTWMNRIGLSYSFADYARAWAADRDYPEYLRHWERAFWPNYNRICANDALFEKKRAAESAGADDDSAAWDVETDIIADTPLMTPAMRVNFIRGLDRLRWKGLVAIEDDPPTLSP